MKIPMKILMKIIVFGLCVFVAVGFSPTSWAREYAVELIVFTQSTAAENTDAFKTATNRVAEKLQTFEKLTTQSQFVAPNTPPARLAHLARALQNSGHTILKSSYWVQPANHYGTAPLVSVGDELSALPDGFIRVYRTALILADVELHYAPPSTGIDSFGASRFATGDNPPHYFIAEKRRLKFGEIHYFDHPNFGAILAVWPGPT